MSYYEKKGGNETKGIKEKIEKEKKIIAVNIKTSMETDAAHEFWKDKKINNKMSKIKIKNCPFNLWWWLNNFYIDINNVGLMKWVIVVDLEFACQL